ncbi:Retrovirus-related Pol polyprotein from transposon 297 [Araneus ventricosus]|uniref:RNA-directed DNA polymerase n=1 Tax=Araneus ventricosus TaxID=182803 RepID=A0A4Y2BIN8_ARAVE|nr:Retrovirus-related Pol polyprotein from transposon 297 [Araneus ventricosus]
MTGIIDSGAQISGIHDDFTSGIEYEGKGYIEISSAFGDRETTPLRIFEMNIDDGVHGLVPVTCAVSKKLDGVLTHTEYICREKVKQVVLPKCKRDEVLRVAHEIPLAGHLGEQETKQSIKYSFFWPGINKDVREFCQTCKPQSLSDHLLHVHNVFRKWKEVGLTVNLEKYAFGQNQVKFLGHVVGSGQHSPDPEMAEVLRNLSRPSTKKELRSFLGLASYYRDYISNFSEIVLPLTDLTKRKVSNVLISSIEAEEAFVKIKDEIIRMPTLHTPDISRPFWLYTDASATAIGACLAQHDDVGKELPIAFFSKKLTPT